MENDIVIRQIHRLDHTFHGIQAHFKPYVISPARLKHPSNPCDEPPTPAFQPDNETADSIIGLVLEKLDEIQGSEDTNSRTFEANEINIENAVRIQDAAPNHACDPLHSHA